MRLKSLLNVNVVHLKGNFVVKVNAKKYTVAKEG